ncbi:discoidin domain-containing receptor 2 isoform X1 [Corythoichthys intestinalis]|uniref:discoidin domain-containing receptor 2 isoform X1 n=1 Tax=Corythoichthys intestinalis TaxID=161448 RepID=UPI0025A51B34|nr:discoidin domain-containing receptor 2 isoform X1 [Corythoichthys intestinalis]
MHLFLLLILHAAAAVAQVDPAHCRYALGMEDGRIKDNDITASSQWHETTGPQYARLNRDDGDGAWCPGGQLEASDSQFLQVDLRRLTFLTVVATQGRYARNGIEFARAYSLNYSRDGVVWKSWRNRLGSTVMEGNNNAYAPVINDLHPPVVTRWVRLIPLTELSTVCMRMELYGCPWEDGLIWYSAPEGQPMAQPGFPTAILNDSTYDGTHQKRRLSGGLGQLTDGVVGLDDFLLTRQYPEWPGYDYLGWKNGSMGVDQSVEMDFVFDRQRNFTSMKVHSNNMFSRGVKIFSSVSCRFKPRPLASWEAEPVVFHTVLDDRNPSARYVTVPLERRAAVAIRCRFAFADSWMMFSEVSFQSEDTSTSVTPPSVSDSSTAPSVAAADPSASAVPNDSNAPVLIGCLVTIILLLVIIIFLILWCQYVCKVLEKAPRRIPGEEMTVRLSSCSDTIILQTPPVPPRIPGGPVQSDPHYERVFLLDPQYQNPETLRNKLPELSQSAEASACGGGYAEPDVTQCTPHQCFHSNAPHYAETDVVRLQGVTGSNMYAVPALTVDSLTRKDISASEFPRQRLIFGEKLGEGQFGEVHLCEAQGLAAFLGEEEEGGPTTLVAVKQLRADATSQARNDFLKEIKIMSRLNHANIIRLLCVCVTSDPLCMVTEYMENGDLNMFLSQREMESTLTHANNIPSVSLADLLHMSVQISSGMRYLASLNFVHRDLATRNCLLDRRLTIKIADFGMSRNLYSSDYYRIQGRAVLPIRWMAWESILLGKFTTSSDVWAFGVTLWEIFTLCKEQPYSLLTDQQVIANTGEFFRNQGRQVFLYAPPLCPPSLFELMMRCWRRDIPDRPSFEGLYQALRPHVNQ